jgi:hypothetical protein
MELLSWFWIIEWMNTLRCFEASVSAAVNEIEEASRMPNADSVARFGIEKGRGEAILGSVGRQNLPQVFVVLDFLTTSLLAAGGRTWKESRSSATA